MQYTVQPLQQGYANQILSINVTTGKMEVRSLDPEVRNFFIGGRGLGLYLLHEHRGRWAAFRSFPERASAWRFPCRL
ncbi:MAG: hypothetical protein BWY42_01785 [Candidatus Omnitrophica bacterium ADurb.Bin277]|nr:MAG: hypothetical protein BWY42_01785 [Candidatus Omnitrophica bacterium ADurb.Bin277]